jgi:parallel beta-helix repeat protein
MKHLLPRIDLWLGVLLLLAVLLGPTPPVVRSANLEVISPADSGPGTLRQALSDAVTGDTITFSPAVFPSGSPVTIFVQSVLPTLDKDNVTIDASNAGVILDGSQAPAGTNGLIIEGDNCVVQGLTIRDFSSNGIFIASGATGNTIGGDRSAGAGPNGQGNLIVFNEANGIEIRGDSNLVQGNYIGIDGSGWWDWGNAFNGVAIWQGASGNIIGGTSSDYRNVIGGNDQNGIWIGEAGTDQNVVIGNYLGTRADGLGHVCNGLSGVAIQDGAQNNRIGGTTSGEGNLISGNADNGIYISDLGTSANQALGNIIGPNRQGTGIIGQGLDGVHITLGASNNAIGDGTEAGRNLISGNSLDGVRIEDSDTMSNTVQGNYIGTNISGTGALSNGLHGVYLTDNTHDNLVGGNRLSGEGNLLSGNGNHGLVIHYGAHHNTASGNLIGPDATGAYSLGNQPFGGIDIAEGAHHNVIGGLDAGEGNLISGNQTDGIALFTTEEYTGDATTDNQVLGNLIGLTLDGNPLPNKGDGVFNVHGAVRTLICSNTIAFNEENGIRVATYDTQIESNTITFNEENGIHIETCGGNTITQNSIYSNVGKGIEIVSEDGCPAPPVITNVSIGPTEIVTGTMVANARVEFFSDDEDEGRVYEGFTTADSLGNFSFSKVGGFTGPNVTTTSTDADGDTSEFSQPAHLLWTLLLYLNGDNDLEEFMFDTITNTVAAGPSPRANVLALVDGYTTTTTYSGTVLYDITRGMATPLNTTVTTPLSTTQAITGERNMGDRQTLVDFVTWGRAHYPARHTMLAIVDHGGGWAPNSEAVPGILAPISETDWMAGNSGLSWDFSSDHDYLDSQEIRQAMATITDSGADPLDVVFYDVCLMGMLEVAYQIKDYASFFVSSQNIGWAPVGPQGRYIQTIQGIEPTATPRQMAELLVQAYADGTPPQEHPFTISAADLASLPTVATAANELAVAISQTLAGPDQATILHGVYSAAQKIDYDSDFYIEPATDGFVDLYDFALRASQQFSDTAVVAAAQNVMTALDAAIVAEEHRSGSPWMALDREWNLDDVHGLSIFLPLGEDLELPIVITETSPITPSLVISRHLRLRDMYSGDQLQFVGDTAWGGLIATYYDVVSSPVPTGTTEGPVDGLLTPDVTPPQTTITVTGAFAVGETITVTWVATDTQTGVAGATWWYRPPRGQWTAALTQTGSSGVFPFTLSHACANRFAVRAIDKAGNVEPLDSGSNMIAVNVQPCIYMPLIFKHCL